MERVDTSKERGTEKRSDMKERLKTEKTLLECYFYLFNSIDF